MNTENEKVVRDLMREAANCLDDLTPNQTPQNSLARQLAQELRAALQSQVSNTPQDGTASTWTLDKSRRYVIRYNEDGEFGQVTGWLYSFADDFYEDATPAYVWRKLPVTVENISPVTGMTPTQQRIHDLECQAETDKAVIEQLLSTPPQQQEQSGEAVQVCPECDIAGCRHIRERATPTATASQESTPTSDQTGREPT